MTPSRSFVRRAALVVSTSAVVGIASMAGPASADVPEGFSNPPAVSALNAVLLLVGVPVALFLLITLLVYLPSMVRGDRRRSAASADSQWFGGPRKGTAELPAPDNEESKAGGASGRW